MLSAATRAQEDDIAAILRCGGIMVLHGIATQNMIGSYRHKWATDRPLLFRLSRSDKVSCGGILGGNEGERTRVVDFFIDGWYPTPTYSENHKWRSLVCFSGQTPANTLFDTGRSSRRKYSGHGQSNQWTSPSPSDQRCTNISFHYESRYQKILLNVYRRNEESFR